MRRVAGLAFGILAFASACGGASAPEGTGDEASDHEHEHAPAAKFEAADADSRAEIALKDFEFSGLPPTLKGPKVHFTLVNVGAVQHEMLVFGADGKEIAAAPPFPGGNSKDLAAELPPGSYSVECRVKEGNKTHADLGMKAALTVS